MSYSSYFELPPQVRKSFTRLDAEQWMGIYNEAERSIDSEPGLKIDQDVFLKAYYEAWKGMRYAKSSRSFVAQVAVEDVDVWNDLPIIEEYMREDDSTILEGGIGTDKHSSKHVWTIWDIVKGVDKDGRDSMVIQGNFFRDRVAFDYSWQKFLKGTSQFSLGSYGDNERYCNKFRCINKVHPVHLFEISIVDVGASPNTGIISIHVPEGEGEFVPKNIVEGTTCKLKSGGGGTRFCVREAVYEGLKNDLKKLLGEKIQNDELCWGYEYMSDMGIVISIPTDKLPVIFDTVLGWAEEVFFVTPPVSNDPLDLNGWSQVLLLPYESFSPFDEETISTLITDEQEAIRGYDIAIEEAKLLFGESSEDAIDILTHIRDEEYEHIYELLELLVMHNYALISDGAPMEGGKVRLFIKNRRGSMEGVANCPPGQHNHPGVEGCHDVMRMHTDLISSSPEGKIDLTDEQIDVNAIKEMPTQKLKAIVLTIVKVMSKFGDEKVAEFMQSSGGKEFTLMFSELVSRSKKGDGMDGELSNVELKEKSLIDPVTDYSALLTVIADLKTKVEHLTSLVHNTKGSILANQEHSGNIADAVSTAVESLGSPEAENGGSAVGNADGGHTTITEGEDGGTEGDLAPQSEGAEGPIADPDSVSADEGIPKVPKDVDEGVTEEDGEPEAEGEEPEDEEEESEPEGDEEESEEEGDEESDEVGEEKEEKKKKKEGDSMSDEEKKKVEEKMKSGEPSTEVEPEVKESTGEAGVGGEPGVTETLGEGEGGGEEGEKETKVKEATGDAFASIQVTPDENGAGLIGDGIPEIPCDAPETNDGAPSIDLSGAGEQENSGGVGVSPGGEPQGTGEGAGVDLQGGKPAEIGAGEKLKGSGIPAENVLPAEIPKGPQEKRLELVSETKPYTSDQATWEVGLGWDTGLGGRLDNSKEVLRGGGVIERSVDSLETKVHYKSADDDVIVVTPESTPEGTGIKLSEGGKVGRNFEALWSAIGGSDEEFNKIKNEVLR